MVFVFTFLGEFGYELLNWHGVIRKFAATLGPNDAIVCCSRAKVHALYESANLYIDIDDAPLFRHSRACCYSATTGIGAPGRLFNRAFDTALRVSLRRFLIKRIRQARPQWARSSDRRFCFVFSSRKTTVRGMTFGYDPDRIEDDGDICEGLDIDNNWYEQIRPGVDRRQEIERGIGFDLSEPYVLMQSRSRWVGPQSAPVPKNEIVRVFAEHARVVPLTFETGRAFDSFSRFDGSLRCRGWSAHSFPDQTCLIHFASHCVFFTEGDLGSHTFVPPLLGRDVTVVAPHSICTSWRNEIDFWNRHVFRFGGQLLPRVSEEVCASPETIREFADQVVRGCRL